MLSSEKISLILTYLVSLGAFFSLMGIASDQFFFPFAVLFLFGIANDFRFKTYLPRWLLNVGGVVFSILVLSRLNLDNLIKPFADLLLFLLVIKSLEKKRPRDMYQMLLLSLFGVAITTTFRLDISFLALFIYELFLGSVAFTFINLQTNLKDRPLSREFLRNYLMFSMVFPLTVALLSVPFFVILPRTQTPLLDLFAKKEQGLVSGITDGVEIGKVGDIQEDNTVAMRVYGNIPPDPYWRVSVFDTLLGKRWIRTLEETEGHTEPSGNTYIYTIVLEPTFNTFIPVLDYPVEPIKLEGLKGKVLRFKGGFYESEEPISKPVRYTFRSTDSPPRDIPYPVYLSVPAGLPDSIIELSKKLSRGDEEEKLRNIVEFFKNGFSYTLKLEDYEGDPLENFLFRTKKGNCEYFASATALLLRLAGIPSRVVGGFKGALKNQYRNYYIVTNSMAHVWVEAYVNGRWVRVDTTPPYMPPAVAKISKLDLLKDAVVSFWYENVVDFSAQKQVGILKDIAENFRSLSLSDLMQVAGKLTLASFIISSLYLLGRIYLLRVRRNPSNLYRALVRKLEKLEGKNFRDTFPEKLLSEIEGKDYYGSAKFIVRLYQKHRFSRHKVDREEIEEGYRLLRKIH